MTLVDELKKKTNAAVDLLLCRTCTVEDKDAGKDARGTQETPALPPITDGTQEETPALPPITDGTTRKKPRSRGSAMKKADQDDERIRSLDLKTKEAKGQYSGSKTRRVSNPKQVRSGDHTTRRVRQPRELSAVNGDTAIIAQGKRTPESKGKSSEEGSPRQEDSGQVVKLPALTKPPRTPRPPKTPAVQQQSTGSAESGPVYIDHSRVVPREEVDRIIDIDEAPCGMSARPRTRAGRREPPAKSARKDSVPDPRRRRTGPAVSAPRDDSRSRDRLDARRAFVVETSPRVEARRRDTLDARKSFQAEAVRFPCIDVKRKALDDHSAFQTSGSPMAEGKRRDILENHRIFHADASSTDSSRNRDRLDARRAFQVDEAKSPRDLSDSRRRDRIDAKRAMQAELSAQNPSRRSSPTGSLGDQGDLLGTAPMASPKRTTLVALRDDPLRGLDSLLTEAEKYEENRKRLFAEAAARRPPTASTKKCKSTETLQSFPSTQDSCTSAASAVKSITSVDESLFKTPARENTASLTLPNPLPAPIERIMQDREIRRQEMKMIDDLLADLDL